MKSRLFNWRDIRRIYRNMTSPESYEGDLDTTSDEVEAFIDFAVDVIESIRLHSDEIDFYTDPIYQKSRLCSALFYAREALCPKGRVSTNPYSGGEFGGGGASRGDF